MTSIKSTSGPVDPSTLAALTSAVPAPASTPAQVVGATASPVAPAAPAGAERLGVSRYGGSLALGGTPRPAPHTVAEAARQLEDLAGLAVRYAAAGKHRIAGDVLREGREGLAALALSTGYAAGQTGALHPGMWKAKGGEAQAPVARAEASLERASREVAELAHVKPVGDGRADVKKTVLLFGLSANPPTGMGGHAGIVAWGGKDLRVDLPNDEAPAQARERVGIDEVWVLPVYKHAFASKSNLLPFEHREAMAKRAFENLPGLEGRVHVKDAEKRVIQAAFGAAEAAGTDPAQVRVGTIDVVRTLMKEHPDTQFVLALGGDTYADLRGGKWKEGDTLQQLVPIVVLPRAGVAGVEGTEENAPKLTDISSTQVRGSTDEAFLAQALHPEVLAYMKAHKLYAFAEPTAGT